MRLLYVRHGESTANIEDISGTTDAVLTDKGQQQAHDVAQKLKAENVQLIFCSPYTRARQTAEIIAAELGIPVEDVVVVDELRERYMGDLEGTVRTKSMSFILTNDTELNFEPRQAFIDRAGRALEKMATGMADKNAGTAIAVSHGQIGCYIREVAKGHRRFEDFGPLQEVENATFVELSNDWQRSNA
jgi:uncharacterized phosphatase